MFYIVLLDVLFYLMIVFISSMLTLQWPSVLYFLYHGCFNCCTCSAAKSPPSSESLCSPLCLFWLFGVCVCVSLPPPSVLVLRTALYYRCHTLYFPFFLLISKGNFAHGLNFSASAPALTTSFSMIFCHYNELSYNWATIGKSTISLPNYHPIRL